MSPAPQRTASERSPLSAVAIIPARLGSTRLPRKMLLRETGRYLFEHTVLNVCASGALELVLLATDSEEILAAAEELGIEALMTGAAHKSGSDRVHEAYGRLRRERGLEFDVILNVQGDEPEVAGADLRNLIEAFRDPEVEFATLWTELDDEREAASAAVVKVILDARGDALFFSRAAIPNQDHRRAGSDRAPLKRHLGVYAFRPSALAEFCALPQGHLEALENLEQLRWLEAGRRLRVLHATHAPRGIDTPQDYRSFVERAADVLSKPPTP